MVERERRKKYREERRGTQEGGSVEIQEGTRYTCTQCVLRATLTYVCVHVKLMMCTFMHIMYLYCT